MILYIDACAREASRTRKLADALVSRLTKEEPDQVVTRMLYKEADMSIHIGAEGVVRQVKGLAFGHL